MRRSRPRRPDPGGPRRRGPAAAQPWRPRPRSPRSAIRRCALEPLLSATISQSIEAERNYNLDDPSPGTCYFSDTRASLGYLNATDDPDLRPRPRHRPARALGGGARTSSSPSPRRARPTWATARTGRPASTPTSTSAPARSTPATRRFRHRRGALPDDLEQLQGDTHEQRYDADVTLTLATGFPPSYEFRLLAT